MRRGLSLGPLLFVIVMEALSGEFRVALSWGCSVRMAWLWWLRLGMIWLGGLMGGGILCRMGVNVDKTKVVVGGEWRRVAQKAVRWPCVVCGRGVGNNSIQCTSRQKWYTGDVVVWG